MEAKDTVRLCPISMSGWRTNCNPICHETQSKLSFSAGIREVVDWIRSVNHSGDFYYSFDQTELEVKLKEWGVL